jgi:hypothetical protein
LIKARGRTIHSDIQPLSNSIWNKEELHEEWKELIIVPIYKKGDETLLLCIHEVLNKMYVWRSALLTSQGIYGCPYSCQGNAEIVTVYRPL